MIRVGETDPHAREVEFDLPTLADPLVGLTGHVFVAGEVRVRLTGFPYVDADPLLVVEKDYGGYALVLTAAQVANRATLYIYVNVAGAQPFSAEVDIGGPIAVGETDPALREVPFHLPNKDAPLTPITGHVFVTGEVQAYVPGGAGFVNALVGNVVEKGYGDYALQLTAAQVAARGKLWLYAKTPDSQPWLGTVTIDDGSGADAGDGGGDEPPPPPPPIGVNVDSYARMMLALLPPGRLWRLIPQSWLWKFFLGCAEELGRLDARTVDLLDEADPSTADETLPEYEEDLDLPSDGTKDEREARVVAALVARQRVRPSDWQLALAPLLGQDAADVVVIERTPAFAASLGDVREIFRWFVYRDPTLPGAYYIESAQALIDKRDHSHLLGTVIESTAALYDDAHSLYDRDLLGA